MDSELEKLFRICDKQGKGFIVKEDILALCNELSLSQNELEEVFEKLDRDKVGFLTLPNFITAYNIYKIQSHGYSPFEIIDREYYQPECHLLLSKLPKSADNLVLMNEMVRTNGTDMLKQNWLRILDNLNEDVNNIEQYKTENIRKDIMYQMQNDYTSILEELELEMENERKRILFQERKKLSKIKESYEQQLILKENQFSEMSEHANELLGRLTLMLRKKNAHKRRKADLLKEKAELLEEVEKQKEVISQLEKQFETFREEMLKECKRSYKNGYESGRKRAKIEEDGLLEELKILQNIYSTLTEGNEEENTRNKHEEFPLDYYAT